MTDYPDGPSGLPSKTGRLGKPPSGGVWRYEPGEGHTLKLLDAETVKGGVSFVAGCGLVCPWGVHHDQMEFS